MADLRRSRHGRLLVIAAVGLLALGLLIASDFDLGLLMVLPALAIAVVFFAWPYPGLELIMRIAARRKRPRRRSAPTPPRAPARLHRGGRLISASLGGRAPPCFLGGL
jgi:hypothetical protein